MSGIEHGIMHLGTRVMKEHGKEIGVAVVGTAAAVVAPFALGAAAVYGIYKLFSED